ncbi:MAG: reactive intermediate/imine deaminase [Chitinophagales bacterium]|nr:MAG: reactive intermediate/imine deaminase [Chitinophagales bacterium]
MADKHIIRTDRAPLPIGPYNQAVMWDNLLFISGQIALHPDTGKLMTDDIHTETKQVMENIGAILEAAGLNFSHVVKATIYLTDMSSFPVVNEVYGQYFDETTAPARETVQVAHLPKDVHVEISAIAIK